MNTQQPTDLDEIAKPRHPLYGKRGTWLSAYNEHGLPCDYIWQNSGSNIIRGYQRAGIKAADLDLETSISNEKTSPRVEIPRVVVETLRIDVKALNAQDIAVFWRLFAQARHHGIEEGTATITLAALQDFLGVARASRIIQSIEKLASLSMSLHVNQPGAHGRVAMPMIASFDIADGVVTFALPYVLRMAVINSRDYGWIDINAIAHFRSKFTTGLFIKASYEAGKHWSHRKLLGGDRATFAAALGLDNTKSNVIEDVIGRVRDDLLAISGPRRRFKISFIVGCGSDDAVLIELGNAAKRLKELKPKGLTKEALDQVKADNTGIMSVPAERYPTITRLRQAATWLGSSVLMVAEQWRMDVRGATSYADDTFVGLSGREFIALIDTHGADDVLEYWLDKRDFSRFGTFNVAEDVGVAKPRPTKLKTPILVAEPQVPKTEVEDDVYEMTGVDNYDYGMPEPTEFLGSADCDNADIPF
ncbi:hypothetical protein MUO32_26190 [Shinella sp. CPCC 101442]|uniref:hypothetical protein n=1 Tax=Shinella sp. CPCC 101442 TaxID=2932265 RepID=UPI00215276DA|nr:hypothetical protein [Shinella sp. CPCC 101442]MCR6502522.1 hypothetical protein [Shinella sp. CPCC 101442]